MKAYSILGINISYSDYDFFINKIIIAAKKNASLTVAPVASHPVTKSFFDNNLKKSFEEFDIILPDGNSLVWAANYLYRAGIRDRIYGPELFSRVIDRCHKENIKILIYGNHTDLLQKTIRTKYKKLSVIDFGNLEGRIVTGKMIEDVKARLKKYRKAILFIGIGSPAQHLLLARLKNPNMPVVAVGAAFDFMSGVKRQAPDWIQNMKSEWLFRLITEPKRLWRRYLIDAPIFVLLIFLYRMRLLQNE